MRLSPLNLRHLNSPGGILVILLLLFSLGEAQLSVPAVVLAELLLLYGSTLLYRQLKQPPTSAPPAGQQPNRLFDLLSAGLAVLCFIYLIGFFVLRIEHDQILTDLLQFHLLLFTIACLFLFWRHLGIRGYVKILLVVCAYVHHNEFFSPYDAWDLLKNLLAISFGFFLVATVLSTLNLTLRRAFAVLAGALGSLGAFVFLIIHAHLTIFREAQKVEKSFLSMDDVGAFFQTNFGEIFEFLLSYFPHLVLARILFFSALFAILAALILLDVSAGLSRKRSPLVIPTAALTLIVFAVSLVLGTRVGILTPVLTTLRDYHRIVADFHEQRQRRGGTPIQDVVKTESGETYVLVIGESANRDHMGAYGYFRDTTPWLSAQLSDPHWLAFNNTYASFTHTTPALTKALSLANQYNKLNDFQTPSLLEVLKAAGFTTVWLSSQIKVGLVDNPLTALTGDADYVNYIIKSPIGQDRTDSGIPEAFEQILKATRGKNNVLLVVHMVGSHFLYSKRLPGGTAFDFPSSKDFLGDYANDTGFVRDFLNPYDTTLRYTDEILSRLDGLIKKHVKGPYVLVYTSDHGEDVYGKRYHDAGRFTFDMARIPFVVEMSDDYVKRYPEKVAQLRNSRERVFTLDLLFDFMLGLTHVKTSAYHPSFDVGHSQYAIDERNAVTMWTDDTLDHKYYAKPRSFKIAEDPRFVTRKTVDELRRLYDDGRFMAIHCDAISRLYEARQNGFRAIEINVKVPEMLLGHGEEGYVGALTLERYLSFPPASDMKTIWLDLKFTRRQAQVSEGEITSLLRSLEELDKRFHIKNRVILETWMYRGLDILTRNGWRVSYYLNDGNFSRVLPNNVFEAPIASLGKPEAEKVARTVAKIITDNDLKDVSFLAVNYPFVKRYLEPLLPKTVAYHTWGIPVDPREIGKMREHEIVKDARVRTIMSFMTTIPITLGQLSEVTFAGNPDGVP
jgi:glucan phosphoethanolaminetransferase (alkaline phosphatase superfamily)